MRTMQLGKSSLTVPVLAMGCWRMHTVDVPTAAKLIQTSLDHGVNFFDHADIYAGGVCESRFAEAIGMTPAIREKIMIQSKCGIVPNTSFDFSTKRILTAVEGSLKRLRTDYLDVLLLHRPDALVEPEEVAAAFDQLESSGKVRHFGVSNQHPYQIMLLQKFVKQPLVANQLQLALAHCNMISFGMHVNMLTPQSVDHDGGILDFCRLHDITIQPWSPFQYGYMDATFIGNAKYQALNAKMQEMADKYKVTVNGIALAWLLRHPAKMQPIFGSMRPERLVECIDSVKVDMSREDWYALWMAAGNLLP